MEVLHGPDRAVGSGAEPASDLRVEAAAHRIVVAAAGPFARDNDFPRHREIFTRRGLARLAESVGLETTFLAPPPVNALFNAASCLSNIGRDRQASGAARAAAAARVIIGSAGHLMAAVAGRGAGSPELVAVCRPR